MAGTGIDTSQLYGMVVILTDIEFDFVGRFPFLWKPLLQSSNYFT